MAPRRQHGMASPTLGRERICSFTSCRSFDASYAATIHGRPRRRCRGRHPRRGAPAYDGRVPARRGRGAFPGPGETAGRSRKAVSWGGLFVSKRRDHRSARIPAIKSAASEVASRWSRGQEFVSSRARQHRRWLPRRYGGRGRAREAILPERPICPGHSASA